MNNGASYLLKGFKLLTHPRLRRFVWVPLFVNTALFSLLIFISGYGYQQFLNWIDQLLPSWLQWLDWLLWLLFGLAVGLVLVFTFSLFANFIAAPFNGFLAERTALLFSSSRSADNTGWTAVLKDIPLAIKNQWRFLLYYSSRALGCLLLFLLPIVQVAAPWIWFGFNAWMMAVQYLTYPMENQHFTFQQIRSTLLKDKWLSFTFGLGVMVAAMVPVVNFFVMPAAVIGATLLWLEHYSNDK